MYIDPIIWLYGQISCSTARITFSTSKTITHLHIKANIGQPIYEYSTTHSNRKAQTNETIFHL